MLLHPWTIPPALVPLFIILVGIGSAELLRCAFKMAASANRKLKVWRDQRRANRPWRPSRQPRMAKRLPR